MVRSRTLLPASPRHANSNSRVNDAGGKVLEMLTDYQGLPNGGDGWLRSLQFVPSENKIHIETYSPLLDKYNKDAKETFSLNYDMTAAKRKAG